MSNRPPQCPSAAAESEGAKVIAIVGGTHEMPMLRYLSRPIPIHVVREAGLDDEDIGLGARLASDCIRTDCRNFDAHGSRCSLATRVRQLVPAVSSTPPPCAIRKSCVWWAQEGVQICMRCPAITREAPANTKGAA